MISGALVVPTRNRKVDLALLLFTAVAIGANLWIASPVKEALHRSTEFAPALLWSPLAAVTCLAFALGWLIRGATRRYRLLWVMALCLATLGWPVSCACSAVETLSFRDLGMRCSNAVPASQPGA